MTDIEPRVARLEAIEDIKCLKARHMYLADSGYPVDELTDLWCEDGTMLGVYSDVDDPAKPGEGGQKPYHGREQIRSFWILHDRLYDWCLHLTASPIIDVTGDLENAAGKWTWLMLATRKVNGASAAVWLGGTQTETYRKERGAWKFHTLRTDVKLVSTHGDGWVPSRYLAQAPV
ncbi:nuclear transport factor 2 family protein [Mesorhizobium sp. B2-4-9]|uniref:nuclear transport factor 2 family protein n=1 Tax=Mesorhizobium sp. B2-4-9 TaxID=2589940 RepID=UPI00112AD0DD|nr:nuclear transport factor 2 family protein [Mesorhizobium sp. B2-4-9]TPL21070.1 nuclear transport factor 2 family protein [Mesorhizobium sp. B2-4-9]